MRRTRAARCRHALLTEHVLDGHFGDGREPGAGRVALVAARGRVPRERTPRAGARGHVRALTLRLTQSAIIIYFFRARAERKGGGARRNAEVQPAGEAVTHRSAFGDPALHHPRHPAITLRHEFNHGMQRGQGAWSRSTTLYSRLVLC